MRAETRLPDHIDLMLFGARGPPRGGAYPIGDTIADFLIKGDTSALQRAPAGRARLLLANNSVITGAPMGATTPLSQTSSAPLPSPKPLTGRPDRKSVV